MRVLKVHIHRDGGLLASLNTSNIISFNGGKMGGYDQRHKVHKIIIIITDIIIMFSI